VPRLGGAQLPLLGEPSGPPLVEANCSD
jgi:hypothetical protein